MATHAPTLPQVSLHRCVGVSRYIVCPDGATYADATTACATMGGTVVVIEDADENQTVSDIVWTLTRGPFWLALSDADEEGQWRWSTGQALEYDAWLPGEPNDWGGMEDCAHGNFGRSGGWNDCSCNYPEAFVCELDEPARPLEHKTGSDSPEGHGAPGT